MVCFRIIHIDATITESVSKYEQTRYPYSLIKMAEAVALLGAVAAGVQCAQVGLQVLILGSSLRAKLQDAPEKVKRWLGQVEQLVALAELIKQANADLSSSSFRSQPPTSSSLDRPASTWVETALRNCTDQVQTLQDILKDMLQEVDDGKGRKI
jgi:hypothetical protein